jgi:uncharacterized protein (DUF697 family)
MTPTSLGWVAAAALVVGAFVRLLKSDMLTIALANFGLPPIPKRVLPWVSLALGVAAAVLDVKLMGTDWPTAIAKGLVAALTATTGHELVVESMRGGKEILAVLLVAGGVAVTAPACTRGAQVASVEMLAEKALCALANQELPPEQILIRCAVQPGDEERILRIVQTSKQAGARAHAAAAAQRCGDAGAP